MRMDSFVSSVRTAFKERAEKELDAIKERHIEEATREMRDLIDQKFAEMLPVIISTVEMETCQNKISIHMR